MKFDLIIKNGTALVPEDFDKNKSLQDQSLKDQSQIIQNSIPKRTQLKQMKLDIGIKNGKIVEIQNSIPHQESNKVVDATGLYVLPGIIDSQVHFREPGLTHKEDLETGTRGALLGGVTAVFEMPNTSPSTTTKELFMDKISRATRRCHTHFAFYIGGSTENAEQLQELESLPHCCGVKIFMGSSTGTLLVEDDATIEKILRHTKKRVISHCEDEFILKKRKGELFPATINSSNPPSVHLHPVWRNQDSALSATTRLVTLANKLQHPVHILHVTSMAEMEFLKNNKKWASVEVLPQHLTLFAPDCYDKLGTKAQQNPPIREQEHLNALWEGIHNNTVDVIGSDHAPHTLEEKSRPYPSSPSGMPGVQTLLPIMLNHVNNGKLSLEKMTELLTENVRDIFQIKNKGRIEIGFDADFTLIDLNKTVTIDNSWIASKSGWSPFHGMQLKGWPKSVILNGQICMQDDKILLESQGQGVEFCETR